MYVAKSVRVRKAYLGLRHPVCDAFKSSSMPVGTNAVHMHSCF